LLLLLGVFSFWGSYLRAR